MLQRWSVAHFRDLLEPKPVDTNRRVWNIKKKWQCELTSLPHCKHTAVLKTEISAVTKLQWIVQKTVRAKNKSQRSSCLCKIRRKELTDVSMRGCEGSVGFVRTVSHSHSLRTHLHLHINCTAPLETSGAIVRYRMRCWEPSSRSTTYSLTEGDKVQSAVSVSVQKNNSAGGEKAMAFGRGTEVKFTSDRQFQAPPRCFPVSLSPAGTQKSPGRAQALGVN